MLLTQILMRGMAVAYYGNPGTDINPSRTGAGTAGIQVASAGSINTDSSATSSPSYNNFEANWVTPTSYTGQQDHWVRFTVDSGTSPSGSGTGSWLALTSDRAWYLEESGSNLVQCGYTIEIATDSGGSNIVCSWSGTIEVDNT